MVSSLIYSNARVKSLENEILNNEKITRMCYSVSLQEAVKILLENGYGAGLIIENPYEYEKLLRAEDERVNNFMREVMPDKSGLEVLLAKIDYHNAKAMLKAKTQGIKADGGTISGAGLIPLDTLENGINDNVGILPKFMADAVEYVNNATSSGGASARLIDVTLDKAYYAYAVSAASKCKSKAIKKYVGASIDIANTSLYLRCRRIGNRAIFDESFIEGGSLDKFTLDKAFDGDVDAVIEKLRYTDISAIINQCADDMRAGRLVSFERAADNYLNDIFKKDRNDIFSVAPLAGYFIAKKNEIKSVRLILVGIKNAVGADAIKDRLRENYA